MLFCGDIMYTGCNVKLLDFRPNTCTRAALWLEIFSKSIKCFFIADQYRFVCKMHFMYVLVTWVTRMCYTFPNQATCYTTHINQIYVLWFSRNYWINSLLLITDYFLLCILMWNQKWNRVKYKATQHITVTHLCLWKTKTQINYL